jgi:chemotaxis protein CheZ
MLNATKLKINSLTSADERLSQIQAAYGDMVATRDIVEVVESMISSLRSEVDYATSKIGEELSSMISFIDTAKSDIASLKPSALANFDIPGATDELDAVVQHTELAAGQIMDCADEISQLSSEVDAELAVRLQKIATTIYEASSFQDITGQRVNKVVNVLRVIEGRLAILAKVAGDTFSMPAADVARNDTGVPVNDRDLLNGPQLAGNGNNQDDIDALLASFD